MISGVSSDVVLVNEYTVTDGGVQYFFSYGHVHLFSHPAQAIDHQCQCESTPKCRRIIRTCHITNMARFPVFVFLCVMYSDIGSFRNDFVTVYRQQADQLWSPRCLQIG